MIHDPLRSERGDPGQAQDAEGGDRVAKLLARAGVGSRRDVERLIGEGRVAINGQTLTTPAVKVQPGDILTFDGEVVGEAEAVRVFRYHKPPGLVTTHKDPAGRPTVFAALPEGLPRLISVGRLDLNSEGLLLLTNDGGLARALELPATQIVRRYRARAHGRITQDKLDTLKDGITVEGVRYGPIEAHLDKAREGPQGANLWLTVTLHEGKNREVRRVLESIGLKVNRLIRLAYGPFALGTLGAGEIEEVGPRVIREQLADHIDAEQLPKGDRPQYRTPAKQLRRAADAEAKAAVPVREPKAKTVYKPGWARPKSKPKPVLKAGAKPRAPLKAGAKPRPKATGSKPGPAPHAGPRGPKPSASRPGSSPARRPGPRSPGGRGPRG